MKKHLTFMLILTITLILSPKSQALAKIAGESDKPDTIEALHKRTQGIEKSFMEAKNIVLPVPPLEDNREISSESENISGMSSEQVLNNLFKGDKQNKLMDLEFEETTLEGILRTIGSISQVNIILDPALKGTTMSIHLKKVRIKDALNIMAESYHLAFKQIGDSLFVSTTERFRNENLTTKLIKLRHIKAAEVKEMTKGVLESINISEDSNAIVAVGTSEEIKRVEGLVKKIDVAKPQVILEAKIIEINKDALKDLGIDWSDSIATSFQENNRPVTFANTESSNGSSPLKVFSFSRNPAQFDMVIKMLENDNKAKILSNPRIITLNNQQSEIFVGDRIPYTITTVTGGVATTEVRFVEPGIRLRITPSIIEKDFVVIKIEPEVSFIFAFRGPQDQYPWVKTRNATAYVRIKNNEPFVLGGLLNQEDKKNLFKVPILGNIPLLGNLFSYQTHTITDSELIITVVPVIINS